MHANMLQIDRWTAERRLTARWQECCEQNPTFANDIPLVRYVAANINHVMRHALLASYEVQS